MVLLFAEVMNPAPQLVAVNNCELSHDKVTAPLVRLRNELACMDALRLKTNANAAKIRRNGLFIR